VKLVGAMRDVTARRERADELSRLDTALETVLSNGPVVFWTTDEAGVFTRSQGGALASLGLEAGEVVGDSLFDVFDDHPEICEQAERALDGEPVIATNTVGDVAFETWFQPVRGDDGDLVGTAGLAYDVTARGERRSENHAE
jgi:PAS domain S-box-containing protein